MSLKIPSNLIELSRVQFIKAVLPPGMTKEGAELPAYSPPSLTLWAASKLCPTGLTSDGKHGWDLWYDKALGMVVIRNPVSGEVEEIPRELIQQMRRRVSPIEEEK
jgi:hypothetical protein